MKEHAKILLIAAAAALLVAAIQGCNLSDLIQTRTPLAVQKSDGLPAKLPLSTARGEYEAWRSDVQRTDA